VADARLGVTNAAAAGTDAGAAGSAGGPPRFVVQTGVMRVALFFTSALAAAVLSAVPTAQTPDPDPAAARRLAQARRLLERAPLVDGHNDLPWRMREQKPRYDWTAFDIRKPQPTFHTDIQRIRAGGLGGQFWSVYVPGTLQGEEAVTATLEQIDAVQEMLRRYPHTFEAARTADDVERIARAGRVASMMGMEGGHSIDRSLAALRQFSRMGVGYMTLTHNVTLPWADAATDVAKSGGLSPFGEEVVREMNRLGMLVDLSHVSPDTMRDALRVTEAPVIFSHSSARAICDVPRNVPDDVLGEVKKNGGVVMVTFVPGFIAPEAGPRHARREAERERLKALPQSTPAAVTAALEAWDKANPGPKATLSQVADHIDHLRKVAGIDHVGIGGDFDGISTVVAGLEDVSTYPALFAELLRRGYGEDDLRKIAGRNVLRAMRGAEEVARRLQKTRQPSLATIEALDGAAVR
jgi:membrane dipeptidase